MVDVDLYEINILTSQDVNMVELSNVKQIKQENKYLMYGFLITGISLIGFLAYYTHEKNKRGKSITYTV